MFPKKDKFKIEERITLNKPKPELLTIPDGVTVSNLANGLHIEIDWKNAGSRETLIIVLLFNCIVSLLVLHLYLGSYYINIPLVIICFLVGLSFMYHSITLLFNKTFLTVEEDRIVIKHKPINFLAQKDRYIPTEEIEHIFVDQYNPNQKQDNTDGDWAVFIRKRGKVDFPFLTGLKSFSDAKFFEQIIEHYLSEVDQPKK